MSIFPRYLSICGHYRRVTRKMEDAEFGNNSWLVQSQKIMQAGGK